MSGYADSSKISISTNSKLNISISNPSNVKQLFDNMKKDLSLVTSYMDLAVKECAEKNTLESSRVFS